MIEINKKEDIVIPFDKIGKENWKENTKKIIDAIAENWNRKAKEPISLNKITELEERLKANLPESLKTFYLNFGFADIGEQLQNFDEIDWIKNIWAEQPEYGPDFTEEDQQYLPFLISFSDYLGNGNMFCFHSETKEFFYFDHESKPYLTKLFGKFDDYLKGCLILAQSQFFGEKLNQEVVEEWTEEMIDELFGEGTIEKWRY